ncbi:hypothetical protein [Staphylococcus shinii]|uniref:hypothetical protein n=1 Tax=Staphylococcus shinii TaxID=2912228 RepID=UPI003F565CDF
MTETTDLKKVESYLTKNNKKKLKEYINGFISVGEIKKVSEIKNTSLVYYALDKISPNAQEERERIQRQLCMEVVDYINRVVPFERMNQKNVKQLLGRKENVALKPEMMKAAITRKRNMYKLEEDKGFDLVSQSRFQTWYKTVCVYRDVQKGEEKPYQIAKRYGIIPRKIYGKLKFFDEHKEEGRIISTVSLKQQAVFLENVDMFNLYKEGVTVKEISEQYNVDESLVAELMVSFEEVENQFNKE